MSDIRLSEPPTREEEARTRQKVVVTDIRMPFVSMVVFLVKLALAAIPALLILYGLFFLGIFLLSKLPINVP